LTEKDRSAIQLSVISDQLSVISEQGYREKKADG